MIDKIWDALWKIGEKIWEAKQKPEHKGKPLKQFWKDWRADVKKQQEEYKKLQLLSIEELYRNNH